MTYRVELAEHIKAVYVNNQVTRVKTHALPGHHHVNNQPEENWIEKLEQQNYRLSIDSAKFWEIALRENADSYLSISGLVFLKID